MAYPRRIDEAGSTYHVNAKAVAGLSVYRDDYDRDRFLAMLGSEVVRSKWRVLAYALLSTHYHVLLTLEEPTLSSGFQRLNGRYARSYNRRWDRRGAVWQRRFFDAQVVSDAHLLETTRYIALNPKRANMCAAPEDWPWCSYGGTIGAFRSDPIIDEAAILRLFDKDPARARAEYRRFVEEKDPRERRSQIRI